MPTSFHSQRESTQPHQHSSTLPLHRSKFYKPSFINNKTKTSLHYLRQRRRRTWLFLALMLACAGLGGHYLYIYSSTTITNNNNTNNNALLPPSSSSLDFPEWTIAQHYQPTPAIGTSIPKIVHFIFGLRTTAAHPSLDVIHYLAIKSAHDRLKPDTIMFHYHYLPSGTLFDKVRPWLTLNKVDLVSTVFDRPVTHYAHQADIVRLAVLQQYGGIYLDIDVISLAPMDHLFHHEFVMGQEGIDGAVGLCNGVIMAKPNARFLQRWRETYRTFNQNHWNYHSVILPGKLAKTGDFDNELTILNHTAFFWPLWNSQGLRMMLLEKSYDFSINYATHVWESFSTVHLMANLSLNVIRHVDNSLYCQLRWLLADQEKVRPCRWLDHSPLANQLVGHWPLTKPHDKTLLDINPTPATDVSGNDMHGIIRNGQYFDGDQGGGGGVYVSGQDSYVFLSMPNKMMMQAMTVQWQMKTSDDKQGGVAMMIQSDTCKVMIKTQAHGVLGVEIWQLATTKGGSWDLIHRVDGGGGAKDDDVYHTFTLALGGGTGSMLVSNVVLYMDGSVIASLSKWAPLEVVVRGIWFGSAEPEKYQDPWDTIPSLTAWYKDLRVWEQSLTMDIIQQQQQHAMLDDVDIVV